jgi:hypothetical protein
MFRIVQDSELIIKIIHSELMNPGSGINNTLSRVFPV